MKRGLFVLIILLFIFAFGFLSATSIGDNIPIQIQTLDDSGNIITGTFTFQINVSNSITCSPVLYSNTITLATDSRGVISYSLENVSLPFNEQYWFCYYRDGILKETIKAARVPYAFVAKNVTSSGIVFDSNLNLSSYNLTTNYLFGNGQYLTGITSGGISGLGTYGYIPRWNGTTSLNNSAIYQNGSNVGIGTTSPTSTLSVGSSTSSATINFSNASTAYYAPNASEPSAGTYHPSYHLNIFANILAGPGSFQMDFSPYVPIGTKAVLVEVHFNPGNIVYLDVGKVNQTTEDRMVNYGSVYVSDHLTFTLDASRKSYIWNPTTYSTGTVYVSLIGYYI